MDVARQTKVNEGHRCATRSTVAPARGVGTILLLAMLVTGPTGVVAQVRSTWEAAGGYAFLSQGDPGETFALGWFASAGWHVSDRIAIVGDLSGHHKEVDVEFLNLIKAQVGVNVNSFLARTALRSACRSPYLVCPRLGGGRSRQETNRSGAR